MLLAITLLLSDFSGVDLPPGDSLVDLKYTDGVFLFGEGTDNAVF